MTMKGIGIAGMLLLLSACAAPPPQVHTPSVTEFNQIESALAQVNVASAIAGSTPPSSVLQAEKHWSFNAEQGLSVIGDPATSLEIKSASDDHISLQVFNDRQASVKGARTGNVLGLRVSTRSGGKVILYLPEKTQYLLLKTFNVLQGQPAEHLRYLNLDGCTNVKLSAAAWMLEYLRINHSSGITLASVKTPYLMASINDSNTVNVQGMMNLRELDLQNSQGVEWYWLNSPILTLNVKNSGVLLAGKVTYANMAVLGKSHLDAKYLLAQRLFIHTDDEASAAVRAADALNALATGHSNIYYYTQPTVLSRYYYEQGSILYQGEQPPVCHLPYCTVPPRVLPG